MDLVKVINDHRVQNGLSRIPMDETLCKVAYYHARDTQVCTNMIRISDGVYELLSRIKMKSAHIIPIQEFIVT